MNPTTKNRSYRNKFFHHYLIILFTLLLVGCETRSNPASHVALPAVTVTPAPVQTLSTFREESLSTVAKAQEDNVVAAVTMKRQPIFVALAQSGLWMGTLQADERYSWSRPLGLPELLTTHEISALEITKNENRNELWVGTHNNGFFRFTLSSSNSEWRHTTTENSKLPSNTVNRFSSFWVMTNKGAAIPLDDETEWRIYTTKDGLLDNNAVDIGGMAIYAGGVVVIATESGVVVSDISHEKTYSRLTGGPGCRFERASRIYNVVSRAWLFIDQKDDTVPNGWRVAGICEGYASFLGSVWEPILLDGVAPPTAHIATHYQDQDEQVWIAFAAETANTQGILAHYETNKRQWRSYQLPAEFPGIADNAVMLRVGNDLWVAKPDQAAFTVLEDVVTE